MPREFRALRVSAPSTLLLLMASLWPGGEAEAGQAVLCNDGQFPLHAASAITSLPSDGDLGWSLVPANRCVLLRKTSATTEIDILVWSKSSGFVSLGKAGDDSWTAHRCIFVPMQMRDPVARIASAVTGCRNHTSAVPIASRVVVPAGGTYFAVVDLSSDTESD